MPNMNEVVREYLHLEYEMVPQVGRRKQIVRLEKSWKHVYVNVGARSWNPEICVELEECGTGVDFCLLGRGDATAYYWGSLEAWKSVEDCGKEEQEGEEEEGEEEEEEEVKDGEPAVSVWDVLKNDPEWNDRKAVQLFQQLLRQGTIVGFENTAADREEQIEVVVQRIREDLELGTLKHELYGLIRSDIRQLICHGAPGTGKTYAITGLLREGWEYGSLPEEVGNFVQFHPSYDYTDFVEGLRPACLAGSMEPTFVRVDGIFKKFCRAVVAENKKEEQEQKKYIFIIDEINRADLSKVFGELMYCLEESNRGEGRRIQTQYCNIPCYKIVEEEGRRVAVPIEEDCFANGFYIPENVVIIGTMNDIDRSVDSFDFAMQRRFHWVEVDADREMTEKVLADILGDAVKKYDAAQERDGLQENCPAQEYDLRELAAALKERAGALNEVIEEKLGRDYKIGQAYYKKFAVFYEQGLEAKRQEEEEPEEEELGENPVREEPEGLPGRKDSEGLPGGRAPETLPGEGLPKEEAEGEQEAARPMGYDREAFQSACEKVWELSLSQVLVSYFRGKRDGRESLDECRKVFLSEE